MRKTWKEKAKSFAKYYRDDYNKGRHIIATLGSYGYTFDKDVNMLKDALNEIGEKNIANNIDELIKQAEESKELKRMKLYKILAIIPEADNKIINLLNKDKDTHDKNLKMLKGRAEIVYSGIATDRDDLKKYKKALKAKSGKMVI